MTANGIIPNWTKRFGTKNRFYINQNRNTANSWNDIIDKCIEKDEQQNKPDQIFNLKRLSYFVTVVIASWKFVVLSSHLMIPALFKGQ